MGNYYDGKLYFYLREDTPDELISELYRFDSSFVKSTEDFTFLKSSDWFKHKYFHIINLGIRKKIDTYANIPYFRVFVKIHMKNYMFNNLDLGQCIYDTLIPYVDKRMYDMSCGGYVGTVKCEDIGYVKEFYVDYDIFNKTLGKRQHICNTACPNYVEGSLCGNFSLCNRSYNIGYHDISKAVGKTVMNDEFVLSRGAVLPDLNLLIRKVEYCLNQSESVMSEFNRILDGCRFNPKFDLSCQMFLQTWGNTSGGLQNGNCLSGQAITEQYTTVFYESVTRCYVVCFGNQPAYLVENPTEKFYRDLADKEMKSVQEARKVY